MPFITLYIWLLFTFLLALLLRYSLLEKIKAFKRNIRELRETENEASLQKAKIQEWISSLNEVLTKTVSMYVIARGICASSFDEEGLFLKFKEGFTKAIDCRECLLLPPEDKPGLAEEDGVSKAEVFPLIAKDSNLGYLVIKGAPSQEKPFMGILVGQFALGLQRVRLYKMIQELAITDSLTGLYTRRYAMERLREEFYRSEAHNLSLSVLMIDVDDFKACNDKLGHLVGDVVLCEIGNRIKDNIREIDMLSRFGGEEFMVFAPGTSKERATLIAERIRKGVHEGLIRAYDEKVKASISIGLSSYPSDAKTPEELVGRADWALYEAKRLGKNRVCVFGVYYEKS